MSVNNYGMSLRGTIEGTALSFTEQFKKVSPKVSGFYTLENEVGFIVGKLILMLKFTERIG